MSHTAATIKKSTTAGSRLNIMHPLGFAGSYPAVGDILLGVADSR
jgi:hypothetical protein